MSQVVSEHTTVANFTNACGGRFWTVLHAHAVRSLTATGPTVYWQRSHWQ